MDNLLLPHQLLGLFPDKSYPKHLKLAEDLCLHLLTDDNFNRLVVEFPLGHGKSEWFSFIFPFWYMLTHPNNRVILAFGNDNLRKRFANKLIDAIKQWGPHLTGVDIHKKYCSIDFIRLADPYIGEIYTTLPNSGASQGLRGDLIIADDLIPTLQMAASIKERETVSEWFWGVLMNRVVSPKSKIITVMSRRHPLDLSGSIQDHQQSLPDDKKWHSSTLEAICTNKEKDPLHREIGEALWPELWPVDELEKIRNDLEDRGRGYLWMSQYQQDAHSNPEIIEFNPDYWKNIFYDELPPNLELRGCCMSIDPSKGTTAQTGDSTAIVVGLLDAQGNIWVENSVLDKMSTPGIIDWCIRLFKKYNPKGVSFECNGFQEEIATQVAQAAIKQGIINFPVIKIYNNEGGGKEKSRIVITLDHWFAKNRIRFRNTPTNQRGIMQFKMFPSGDHDDFCDACEMLVQAFIRCGF